MKCFLVLLFLMIFSFTKVDNDSLDKAKVNLLSEDEITEDEILKFCFSQYYAGINKFANSAYIDTFYSSDEEKYLTSLSFCDIEIYQDAMAYTNYCYNLSAPEEILFEEGNIYYFKDYVDSDQADKSPSFYLTKMFEVIYGVNIYKIGRCSNINYDDFSEDSIDYEDYNSREQDMLRIINNNFNNIINEDNKYDEFYVFYPNETITLHKKENINLDDFGWRYKWSSVDEGAENYILNDFGYYIYSRTILEHPSYVEFNNPSFIIDVNNPISYEDLKAQITATDPTDGDLTNKIVFSNNTYILEENKIAVGKYSFDASVTDSYGNTSTKTFNVVVVDIDAPTLNTTEIKTRYNVILSDEDIINMLDFQDNYSSKENISYNFTKHKYRTANVTRGFKAVGRYSMTIELIDEFSNKASYNFTIVVFDDVPPVVSVPEVVISYTSKRLTLDEIKALYVAEDEYCPTLFNNTVFDYDGYKVSKKVRDFRFGIYVEDNYQNDLEVVFIVRVVDDDFPIIDYNKDYLIITSENEKLTQERIVDLLLSKEEQENVVLTSIESEYFTNNNEIGSYNVLVKGYNINTNEEINIKGTINVLDSLKTEINEDIKEIETNFLMTIWENNKLGVIVFGVVFLILILFIIYFIIKKHPKKDKK